MEKRHVKTPNFWQLIFMCETELTEWHYDEEKLHIQYFIMLVLAGIKMGRIHFMPHRNFSETREV